MSDKKLRTLNTVCFGMTKGEPRRIVFILPNNRRINCRRDDILRYVVSLPPFLDLQVLVFAAIPIRCACQPGHFSNE